MYKQSEKMASTKTNGSKTLISKIHNKLTDISDRFSAEIERDGSERERRKVCKWVQPLNGDRN